MRVATYLPYLLPMHPPTGDATPEPAAHLLLSRASPLAWQPKPPACSNLDASLILSPVAWQHRAVGWSMGTTPSSQKPPPCGPAHSRGPGSLGGISRASLGFHLSINQSVSTGHVLQRSLTTVRG